MKKTKQILKPQIIAKFEEFLKENNCYEEFVKNTLTLNNGHWKTIEEYYYCDDNDECLALGAFVPLKKDEQHWYDIHKKWRSRYEELISEEN